MPVSDCILGGMIVTVAILHLLFTQQYTRTSAELVSAKLPELIASICETYLPLSLDILAKIGYNKIRENMGGARMITVTATDMQNNFGKYLQAVQSGDEIIILKNGKEVARMISHERSVSFLTDALTGVLKNDYDDKAMRAERIHTHEDLD